MCMYPYNLAGLLAISREEEEEEEEVEAHPREIEVPSK